MATIGEIILTNNTNEISKVDAVQIGNDDAVRVYIDFDIDDALKRFARKQIIDAYVENSILKMIYFK